MFPLSLDTTALFSAICAYMLQSSLAYTGRLGALVGVTVLLVGVPLLLRAADACLKEKNDAVPRTMATGCSMSVAILELADALSPDYGSSRQTGTEVQTTQQQDVQTHANPMLSMYRRLRKLSKKCWH